MMMDVRCNRADLLKALGRVLPAIGKDKSPVAIMSCALLSAEWKGPLRVAGTDTFVAASTAANSAEIKKPGAIAVKGRDLFDAVKAAPANEVTIAVTKDGKRVSVKSGKWERKMGFIDGFDFPPMPTAEHGAPSMTLPSATLAALLGQVQHAASPDDTRDNIACARLELRGDRVHAFAADGVGMSTASSAGGSGNWTPDTIAQRFLADVRKMADGFSGVDVNITSSLAPDSSGYIHLAWPELSLSVKRGDRSFSSHERLVPTGTDSALTCHRESLIGAIKRAMLAADDEGVDFHVSAGSMAVKCESSADGESVEQVDVDYAGDAFAFRLNGVWLTKALTAIVDDDVLLRTKATEEKCPVIIEGAADASALSVLAKMRMQ